MASDDHQGDCYNRKENKKSTNGDKRMYGYFRCDNCRRSWESGNSWEGYAQECLRCGKKVYPYELSELERPDYSDDMDDLEIRPGHPQHLCEKCKELGSYCRSHVSKK
ncbi:Zinc finger CCHC domain-containing protein 24 [Holothuria leucospilota]|uniref:Zinc finger CCHC domain-containing protein 24 n=1 Tax=Holothuria leucospilota TaxID=206669 RepID=A0A9Q1C2G4_HOLLE|nr:Zinc finger CCHC domain-containing protein 24 [Holothuria leucospilota]